MESSRRRGGKYEIIHWHMFRFEFIVLGILGEGIDTKFESMAVSDILFWEIPYMVETQRSKFICMPGHMFWSRTFRDDTCPLFGKFFDLDSGTNVQQSLWDQ